MINKRLVYAIVGISCSYPFLNAMAELDGGTHLIKSAYVEYNSERLVLEFTDTLAGGCTYSTIAYSNPVAKNNKQLIAFALTAFALNLPVEVGNGGGCTDGDQNWITTLKVKR